MPREDPQYKLRIPAALKAQIEIAAQRNGRSMNMEIVDRLLRSFAAASEIEGVAHQVWSITLAERLLDTISSVREARPLADDIESVEARAKNTVQSAGNQMKAILEKLGSLVNSVQDMEELTDRLKREKDNSTILDANTAA